MRPHDRGSARARAGPVGQPLGADGSDCPRGPRAVAQRRVRRDHGRRFLSQLGLPAVWRRHGAAASFSQGIVPVSGPGGARAVPAGGIPRADSACRYPLLRERHGRSEPGLRRMAGAGGVPEGHGADVPLLERAAHPERSDRAWHARGNARGPLPANPHRAQDLSRAQGGAADFGSGFEFAGHAVEGRGEHRAVRGRAAGSQPGHSRFGGEVPRGAAKRRGAAGASRRGTAGDRTARRGVEEGGCG